MYIKGGWMGAFLSMLPSDPTGSVTITGLAIAKEVTTYVYCCQNLDGYS